MLIGDVLSFADVFIEIIKRMTTFVENDEFPIALADRHIAAYGLVNDRLTDGLLDVF